MQQARQCSTGRMVHAKTAMKSRFCNGRTLSCGVPARRRKRTKLKKIWKPSGDEYDRYLYPIFCVDSRRLATLDSLSVKLIGCMTPRRSRQSG